MVIPVGIGWTSVSIMPHMDFGLGDLCYASLKELTPIEPSRI